jgi:hypothetical protein
MSQGSDEDREEALMRIGQSISDGSRVDWNREETTRPELQPVLESMRALEEVAQGHRSIDSAEAKVPTTWGTLEIRERIGRGGFGEVYRAYDPVLQAEVALKLRRKSGSSADSRRFLIEARKLVQIRHPNILVVHGADERDGRVGLWTDLVKGQTLEQMLQSRGPFSAEEAAHIGIQVCRALAAVHAAGLVHCDVKTMNVMRAERGQYVLMDFGSVEEPGATTALGTPIAMSPEQIRGEPVGPAADIWGLGVLLYRLVSGKYPIEAATFQELLMKHGAMQVVPLRDARPDVPGGFARVVERALSFDPARRYPTVGAMEHDLVAAIGGANAEPDPWPAWLRRAAVPLAAAALLAVVTLGLVAIHGIDNRWPWEQPAAPAAPAVGRLTATAHVYRDDKAGPKLLIPGSTIHPGDNLFLEILGTDSMYVYVINQDDLGHAYVLFPGPSFDMKGALPPGVTHRLPGTHAGTPVNWVVSSAGGRETITVIAARRPRQEIERDIASIPKASLDADVAYGAVSPRTLEVLRGIGGVTQEPAPAAGGPSVAGKLIDRVQTGVGGEVWTWQIDLMNPAP